MSHTRISLAITTLVTALHLASLGRAQEPAGTAFLYQGRLSHGSDTATGVFDFQFSVFDSPNSVFAITGPVVRSGTPVTNGLFTVNLDFGNIFNGNARFLQILVRTNSGGAFATLSPRQRLSVTPYSIRATEAASVTAGAINSLAIADGAITAAKIAPGAVSVLGASDGTPTNALLVNTNGFVGIGTNAPRAGLHVAASGSLLQPQMLSLLRDEQDGYTNLNGSHGVAFSGNLLAVAAVSDGGVTLVDTTNPSLPARQTQLSARDSNYTNLLGATDVALRGNLLAVAASTANTVMLLDVTSPGTPVKRAELRDGLGGWNSLAGVRSVALLGNLLVMASPTESAVTLADISNPSAPVLLAELRDGVGGYTNLAAVQEVALSGSLLAIVSVGDSALTLVDVSNPAAPIRRSDVRDDVGGLMNLSNVNAVALSGNLLATAGPEGVMLVNVSNPSSPVRISSWNNASTGLDSLDYSRAVAFSGSRLVSAGSVGIVLFDVSDPANARIISGARQGTAGFNWIASANSLAFSGTNLAVPSFNTLSLISFAPAPVGIVSSGFVGIGTDQPVAPLHVVGNVIVEGAEILDVDADRIELGRNAFASGDRAVALSADAAATADRAVAVGAFSRATGIGSVALGESSQASGSRAVSLGDNEAVGISSLAAGQFSTASGTYSVAIGYDCEAAGRFSMALGTSARSLHRGSFVWADGGSNQFGGTDFTSTSSNQFLIRAMGGVGINVTNPAPGSISIAGKVGLGTTNPQGVLDIATGAGTVQFRNEGNLVPGINISGGNIPGILRFRNALEIHPDDSGARAGSLDVRDVTGTARVLLRGQGNTYFNGGNVGVGTNNPQRQLHVTASSQFNSMFESPFVGGTWVAINNTSTGGKSWDLISTGSGNGEGAGKLLLFTDGGRRFEFRPNGDFVTTGAINPPSDRNLKENFKAVDTREILDKVNHMPITEWNYRHDAATKHVGPVAQDFHASFGVGADDKHISTVDADGVAFAAIQGLNHKLEEALRAKDAELQQLRKRLEQIERRLPALDQ